MVEKSLKSCLISGFLPFVFLATYLLGNKLVVGPSFSSLHPLWCHLTYSSVPRTSYKGSLRPDSASQAVMRTQVTWGACYSDSDSVGLEWGQRRCISNKSPGNTYGRGLIRFRDFFFSLFFFKTILIRFRLSFLFFCFFSEDQVTGSDACSHQEAAPVW